MIILTFIMGLSKKEADLYTDIVLELFSAYVLDDDSTPDDLSSMVMEAVREDDLVNGPGLMEGLLFSCILHMAMIITFTALKTGMTRKEVLEQYALVYQSTKDSISHMPQVHPEIVNSLVQRLEDFM
jgi:hypothetical protein